jgi:hypothetical protein
MAFKGQKSCTEVVKYYLILHLKGGHSSLKAKFTTDHLYYQDWGGELSSILLPQCMISGMIIEMVFGEYGL